MARQLRPDVVLLDVMLPGLSGLDVVREIRADESLRDTPVLVDDRFQRDRVRRRGRSRRRRPVPRQAVRSPELTDGGARHSLAVSPAADVQIEPVHAGRLAASPSSAGASRLRRARAARREDRACERAAGRARRGSVHHPRDHALRAAGDDQAANRSKDITSATLVLEQDLLQFDAALRGYVNTGDRRFLRTFGMCGPTFRRDRGARTQRCRSGRAGAARAASRHRRPRSM